MSVECQTENDDENLREFPKNSGILMAQRQILKKSKLK